MTVSLMATKPRRVCATLHTRTLASPLKILTPNLRRGRRACQHTLWHWRAVLASPAEGLRWAARSATHLRQHRLAHALRLAANGQAKRDHLGLLWASHRSHNNTFQQHKFTLATYQFPKTIPANALLVMQINSDNFPDVIIGNNGQNQHENQFNQETQCISLSDLPTSKGLTT